MTAGTPTTVKAQFAQAPQADPGELLGAARRMMLELDERAGKLEHELRSKMAVRLRACRRRASRIAAARAMRYGEKALGECTARLEEERVRFLDQLSREALELSISIAEEIIQERICRRPASLLCRIRRVLNELKPRRILAIKAHPSSGDLKTKLPCDCDPSIRRGDAVILTDQGELVLDWKAHLDRIAAHLRQMLQKQLYAGGRSAAVNES